MNHLPPPFRLFKCSGFFLAFWCWSSSCCAHEVQAVQPGCQPDLWSEGGVFGLGLGALSGSESDVHGVFHGMRRRGRPRKAPAALNTARDRSPFKNSAHLGGYPTANQDAIRSSWHAETQERLAEVQAQASAR